MKRFSVHRYLLSIQDPSPARHIPIYPNALAPKYSGGAAAGRQIPPYNVIHGVLPLPNLTFYSQGFCAAS